MYRFGRAAGYNAPMRYRLRTLMVLLAVLPPALAYGWSEYSKYRERELLLEELRRESYRLRTDPNYPQVYDQWGLPAGRAD